VGRRWSRALIADQDLTTVDSSHTAGRIAIVLKGYPRLSETFIAQELLTLQRAGVAFDIYALRRPHDGKRHPIHDEITARVFYLPEYLHQEPARVATAWREARRLPGYAKAQAAWFKDLRREPTRNRFRRFGQAVVLATEMADDTRWIYAHFLHTPASVARYAALLRGLPWSCSAHAKDIYTTTAWDKSDKLAELQWLVTCTAANVDYLRALSPAHADKVQLLYHGLDLTRFPAAPARVAKAGPVTILSVGRAVPKKGYNTLLAALAQLPAGTEWRFVHIGGGDLLPSLKTQAAQLGIADRLDWRGSQAQAAVLAAYGQADIFVLASRIADDGDRDGLPNVLMEAQSQGVACVGTRVSALPELIHNEETGLLVPPDDPAALAAALQRLIVSPELRARLGAAGAARVRSAFDHHGNVAALLSRFPVKTAIAGTHH
jgi:glycosyltransferase involved in cell wall biosynthesis